MLCTMSAYNLLKWTFHASFSFGQDQSACMVSSAWSLHSWHKASFKTCLWTKLACVGIELVPAHHIGNLTQLGTRRLQIDFHTFRFSPSLKLPSTAVSTWSNSRQYADLTKKTLSRVWGQKWRSSWLNKLRGMALMAVASSGIKGYQSRPSSSTYSHD